jgi:hypothetical protein
MLRSSLRDGDVPTNHEKQMSFQQFHASNFVNYPKGEVKLKGQKSQKDRFHKRLQTELISPGSREAKSRIQNLLDRANRVH